MARKRRSTTRRRSPARRFYRRATSTGFNPVNLAIGTGLVAVGEPILDSYIDKFTGGGLGSMATDGLKIAGGYFIAKKMKNPIARSAGMALMVIGVRNLVRPIAGRIIGAPQTASTGNGFTKTVF